MVHRYGPHVFHTASQRVWAFIQAFGEMMPYRHRVRAVVGDREYSLPINLTTISEFFGTELTPDQARQLLAARAAPYATSPQDNFRDRALASIGPELYEAFFAGYTVKQWGIDPSELPASVFDRLPIRFTSDDEYFDHPHQAIPRHGYTAVVEAILDHPLIDVELGRRFDPRQRSQYDHLFWTGPLDGYFDRRFGALRYRTLDFEFVTLPGVHQASAVVNHCDRHVPYTRVTEYRHFAAWEQPAATTISRERPRDCGDDDIPYYPVRLLEHGGAVNRYLELARAERGVTFLGRLGTFRYLDMDNSIDEALTAADSFLSARRASTPPPVFAVDVS